jgi:peptide/nickel transport system substrate-binding protein
MSDVTSKLTRRRLGQAALAGTMLGAGIAPAAAATKTLTIGASVFPDGLRPGISSFASASLLEQVNEALYGRDNAGRTHPALAESYTQLDELTAQFKLRQGVKFHDGSELTAEDVAFTINYVIDVKNGYGLLARIAPVTGATAVDRYTVNITTKAVFPTLLQGLSNILIQSKAYFAKVGFDGLQAKPMGTGPFVFARWTPGDRYELTANKAYWGGAPKLDRVVIREIPDPGTRIASLVAGETQIIEEVPIDLIPQIEGSRDTKVDEIVSSVGLILTYDVRVAPFNNPKVREAFDHAIDKEAIRKEILKGRGEILQGQLLTSTTFGFNPGLKARPFDPEKARALLKEAGFNFRTPVPITTQSGKYVSDVDICNAVAGMLSNIGVNATVNVVEGGVWTQMQRAQKAGPIYMIGWYSLGDADFASVWFTEGSKRSVWTHPEYEQLFLAARSTNDQAAREKAYHRMMEILYAENPAMFLFGLPSLYAVSRKVSGFGAASDKILRLAKADIA